MTTAKQLSSQIKAARVEAGLSLRKLGAMADIPATTIEGYEAGNKIPADNFLRIADALGHHDFDVDGRTFTVGRAAAGDSKAARGEQLRLDFSGEYDYSRAKVKISPGKITVAFDCVRHG